MQYQCVGAAALRRYDYFRWLVLGSLLILLILLIMFRGWQRESQGLTLSTHRLVNATAAGVIGRMTAVLQVKGVGQPGTQVELKYEDEPVATATVGVEGHWTLEQRIELPPGRHILQSRMVSEDGSLLDEAEPLQVVMPEMAATQLTVDTHQVDDFSLGSGAGLVAGVLRIRGTGHPGANVEIAREGTPVVSTKIDADGQWALDQRIESPPGNYEFRARMLDKNGSPWDEVKPFELSFPEVKIADLKLTVAQLETSAPVSTQDVVEGWLTLSGQGQSGLAIRVLSDGEYLGETIVDAGSHWSFEKGLTWKAGTPQLTAHMLATNGDILDELVTTVDFPALSGANAQQTVSGGSSGQSSGGDESARPVVELILDASGSMWAKMGEKHRFQIASELLISLIDEILPAGTPVALRVFGNMQGNYSCRNDLMVPLKPLDRDKMKGVINAIVPKNLAGSAIADSLSQVTRDLAEAGGPKIIILITDGNESCDGNPAAAIKVLAEQNENLRVDIVGIAIEDRALKSEYERWATLGHGRYYDARSTQELTESLAEALILP